MTQSVAEGAVPESGESVIIELQPPEVFYPEQSLNAEKQQQAGAESPETASPEVTETSTEEPTDPAGQPTEQSVNNENE